MFTDTISPQTAQILSTLGASSLPKDSYLAGGTAIALQIGHRKSLDLDFFTPSKFAEDAWEEKLEEELNFKTIQKDWQTLLGNIASTKFSLFYYPHKLINLPVKFNTILVASLPDLAAIKLATVISRGAKRDLIDIYFLIQKYSLAEILAFYEQKYGDLADKEIMIKKALVYFDDADNDETPQMLTNISWETIKKDLVSQVKNN